VRGRSTSLFLSIIPKIGDMTWLLLFVLRTCRECNFLRLISLYTDIPRRISCREMKCNFQRNRDNQDNHLLSSFMVLAPFVYGPRVWNVLTWLSQKSSVLRRQLETFLLLGTNYESNRVSKAFSASAVALYKFIVELNQIQLKFNNYFDQNPLG